ncbi:Ig-like domain repeat protein [Methanosphaera sp. BMS]|uniref:beta strand repeat-containing protein n=1 Tax=Methanosphaera sp. BMS TaxID=1789762 RepID=UPI000DC1E38A|nr:Ig-like domain repeat protein [Methanosphaera sp. BMS]AWX33168.1 hypothetical protein AW729_08745 [Methanosphaera sp. BMS]
MKKIKEVLLFVIVLVLLVGVATAADIQNESTSDTITTQSTDINTKETVQNTNTITDIEENIINEKKINKKEENLKTASQTHDVSDYAELKNALNSTDEEVTININSNITLTASPTLNTNIKTITINGNSYTINGDNKYRFLNITSNQMLNLNNITITNCHAQDGQGGAIYNTGTLNINNTNFTENTATGQIGYGEGGAIYNTGTLTITNTNLNNNTATGQEYGDGDGGAIYNAYGGTINITQSNLTQNTATGQEYGDGDGGAIYNAYGGTINITQSNLTQNTATGQLEGVGGAIYNAYGGTLNITQSNLTQNTATGQNNGCGGAIHNSYGGTLNITQSNLTQNTATGQTSGEGGAIHNTGTLTITQSNLTQNTATGQTSGEGGAIYNIYGTINMTQSKLNENTANGQYNGVGGAIYNEDGTLNITQSNLNNNTATGQQNGVGGAIHNAYGGNLNINDSILEYNNATKNGGAINNVNGSITLNNTNLTYNNATEYGGAIVNNGTGSNLTILNSNLTQNKATGQNGYGFGGAIYNRGGNLNITQSNLTQNNATGQNRDGLGGAIYNEGGNLTITQSNLTQNTATGQNYGYGGAIHNYAGTINITNANITNNTATGQNRDGLGGAIYNEGGNLTITQSNLTQNTATGQNYGYGGAIHNYAGTINITNANITNNTATGQLDGSGGAIYNYGGTLTITDSNLTQNKATGQTYGLGGAIYNTGSGTLTITQSNLTQNKATGHYGWGGAIYNNGGNLTITQSNLTQNKATGQYVVGGAIYNSNGGNLNITQSNLNNNTASTDGGAIYNYGLLTIIHSILENNKAGNPNDGTGRGGAIHNGGESFNISNSTLTNNTAYKDGAAIYNNRGVVVVEENNFIANNAPKNGEPIKIAEGSQNVKIEDNIGDDTTEYNNTIYTNTTGQGSARVVGNVFYDEKVNTTLTISSNNTNPYVYDVINLTFHLTDVNNKNLSNQQIDIKINNQEQTLQTNQYGIAYLEYMPVNNQTITVNASHPETTSYKYSTRSILIPVEKINTTLNISKSDETVYVNKTFNITVELLDVDKNGVKDANITLTIKNTTDTLLTYNNLTGENGKLIYPVTVNNNDTITVEAKYANESTVYKDASATLEFNVEYEQLNTTIEATINNTQPYVNDTINITYTLKDQLGYTLPGQNILVTIKDQTNTITTNNEGIASIEYTPTNNQTTTITATYKANNPYQENSTTIQITANKIDTQLTLTVSNNTPINNTPINITVTLTDTDDNKLTNQNITITTGDKTFTVKTNNNGIVTQTYMATTLGKQTITATYNGNSQYINSTATTSITVKKINTKLSVKVSNSTPVNNTNITITATLTDADNKAIANQNITIKVSDKTFNIKTNNNGIATQTYTPTKVEKQTITATYNGDSQHNSSTATTNITVKKINTKIDLKVSNTTPINNTQVTITVTLTDADGNKLANQQVTLNINGKTVTAKTNNNGIVTQNYTPTKVETQNITATYTGDSRYNNSTKTIKITVKNKIKTQTTVNPVIGVIGEKLTIKATVTDTNGGKVNEGNLIFKVNGVTIKDNGKLTGSNNPLKIKVVKGVATATIIPDINMTNAKNITAYYVGTTIYNASTSSPASINISKRNATIEVTTNKKIIKQGQVLTITAKIYDTTNGKKTSNITRYQDEYVYFKINGITLKDANGEMLKVKIVNGTATVNYTIPLGISCVTDMQTLTPKNHTIQVGLYNKNYQNIMTKTPTFQVERSNITINLANATINNRTHTLSMKITIKDYLGNVVAGPNKCIIKVNGVTLKNGTNVQYYYTTDGVLDLKNIPVPQSKNYANIEVITQDRLAYNSQRNTTKVIKITN